MALYVAPFELMAKFRDENRYDALVRAAAALHQVPVPLVKAVIGAESGYNPQAYRAEPNINDASRGLMQLLEQTARTLGYHGSADQLYDPLVNIGLGTQLLAANFKHAQNGKPGADPAALWEVAISAYNAGWSRTRPNDAKREASGKFVNQRYVDKVLRLTDYYGGAGLRVPPPDLTTAGATLAVVAAVATGLYWLIFHS